MNAWQIIDADTDLPATTTVVIAATALAAVKLAITNHRIDPSRGYVARRVSRE